MAQLIAGAGEAARARRLDIRYVGGEAFEVSEVVHDNTVIWSELFSEQERRLLKKELKEQSILFSIRDNFEVVVRCVWQQAAKDRLLKLREGHTAVLLHDSAGTCANGWCWGKVIRPLYNRGFSVVMLEWPGFGNSRFNTARADDAQRGWHRIDGDIVMHVLSELGVGKFHIVAHGRACEAALRIMQTCPQRLEKSLFFHDPVIDVTRFFPRERTLQERRIPAAEWDKIRVAEATQHTATLLREAGFGIFTTFSQESRLSALVTRTREVLLACREVSIFLNRSLILEDVTHEDVTEAQLGVHCDFRVLFLSKRVRKAIPGFLRDSARVTCLADAENVVVERGVEWTADLRSTWNDAPAARLSIPSRKKKGTRVSIQEEDESPTFSPPRLGTAGSAGTRASSSESGSRPTGSAARSDGPSPPGSAASLATASPPGSAPSPGAAGSRRRKRGMQRPASEGALRALEADPLSTRPPEAAIAGATRRALGELYSDPREVRRSLVSRVPRDLLPHDPALLRRPVVRDEAMLDEEFNQLEDGLDASVLHYIGQARQKKSFMNGSLTKLKEDVPSPTKRRDPELTQSMVKNMNKAFRTVETTYYSQKPRKLFGLTF